MLIRTDGGSKLTAGLSAWAFVVYNEGKLVHSAGGFMAEKTCSEAEYQGLIQALHYIIENPDQEYDIQCDSKLVVEQTMGRWRCKEPRMKALQGQVKALWQIARPRSIKHIPREKNVDADAICTKVMDEQA